MPKKILPEHIDRLEDLFTLPKPSGEARDPDLYGIVFYRSLRLMRKSLGLPIPSNLKSQEYNQVEHLLTSVIEETDRRIMLIYRDILSGIVMEEDGNVKFTDELPYRE